MTNVMHHLPSFMLVFADKDGKTLPLGNAGTVAGTASASLAAHGDALGVAPRDHLTVGTLRELESAWLPSIPTIEGNGHRLESIVERLFALRVLAVADIHHALQSTSTWTCLRCSASSPTRLALSKRGWGSSNSTSIIIIIISSSSRAVVPPPPSFTSTYICAHTGPL
jgi:hypothetical protein